VISIDYDKNTKELMSKVRQADALMGARGNANLQASFAKGIEAAGENPDGGALGMGFMGMGIQGVAGTIGTMQQPAQQQIFSQPESQPVSAPVHASEDPYEKLAKLKGLLDQGVISQEDFDTAKSKLLEI
jgi:membrane protease subunit (stomatin/prohibitin family)